MDLRKNYLRIIRYGDRLHNFSVYTYLYVYPNGHISIEYATLISSFSVMKNANEAIVL